MNQTTLAAIMTQLRLHLEGTSHADRSQYLADNLSMLDHRKPTVDCSQAWGELARCLDELNVTFNEHPSQALPRELAYAVHGLIMLCLEQAMSTSSDAGVREQLLLLAWRIGVAWDAILAGDIDSISEHVRLEESAL